MFHTQLLIGKTRLSWKINYKLFVQKYIFVFLFQNEYLHCMLQHSYMQGDIHTCGLWIIVFPWMWKYKRENKWDYIYIRPAKNTVTFVTADMYVRIVRCDHTFASFSISGKAIKWKWRKSRSDTGFLPPPGGPIAPTKFTFSILRKSPISLLSYQPICNKLQCCYIVASIQSHRVKILKWSLICWFNIHQHSWN